MRVLALSEYYLPGYKAGGTLRALANLVERLGGDVEFFVIARDRDRRDSHPYAGLAAGSWQMVGRARVFYLSPRQVSLRVLRQLIVSVPHDVLYLNSFFSPAFAIKPFVLRWLGLIPRKALIIAPRGEFSRGALEIKAGKKRLFLLVARALKWYQDALWQASSHFDERDIRRCLGESVHVAVAPDLAPVKRPEPGLAPPAKERGHLKVIFLSRISPVKNLKFALERLSGLQGRVEMNIYGPMDDPGYWDQCRRMIGQLPGHIKVEYLGSIPHERVQNVIGNYHLFFLPSKGENFGHVILEALVAGCPVLISDRTPWRELEAKGVGWDVALEHPELFSAVLRQCVAMDEQAYRLWSERARDYARHRIADEKALDQNAALFRKSIAG